MTGPETSDTEKPCQLLQDGGVTVVDRLTDADTVATVAGWRGSTRARTIIGAGLIEGWPVWEVNNQGEPTARITRHHYSTGSVWTVTPL